VNRHRSGDTAVTVRRGVLNEERWQEILQAASDEFYEKGFRGARLKDIASRVDLLTGSLYYYIESKENLLFALVDAAFQRGLETTEEDPALANASAATRLRAFIWNQMRSLDGQLSRYVIVVARDRKYLSAEHQRQFDQLWAELRGRFVEILEQGIAEGVFDPTIDLDMTTNTFFALMGATSEWAEESQHPSWDRIADWYVRLFLRSLATGASDDRCWVRRGSWTDGSRGRGDW
jgi:AcrR family transcriptional regulator